MNEYRKYLTAIGNPHQPTLFLDLNNFEANLNFFKNNSNNKKIRIATKSIRCKELLKKILNYDQVFQGIMTYDLREALWLRDEGFRDILMGYPTTDLDSLKKLSQNPEHITLMVDLPEHLEIIHQLCQTYQTRINICLDIDLSLDLPGVRFGVYRSKVNNVEKILHFLNLLKKYPLLNLKGLMGYEAQIAGVFDKNSPLIRLLKKISVNQLRSRRKQLVDCLLSAGHHLSLINGGGTGSLHLTNQEDIVTEVTIGSGFFSPVLFDYYKDFSLKPSLFFTIPIVRNPLPDIYTCLGGGYIGSGSTDKIKQPNPYLPEGARLIKHEGAGEVQTPVYYNGAETIKVGDSIIMRHAKAGEVCERFEKILIIKNFEILESVPTYRGDGKTFV
jgi:D-serine deaminase-like pyridoxal phosphate-dependent protein